MREGHGTGHGAGHGATPEPPYVAVIFTSLRKEAGAPGYEDAATAMARLAADMPGYIGHTAVRGADGLGVTVSYWRNHEAVAAWRRHPEHAAVIARGRSEWYEWYVSEVAIVERAARHGA